jgi:hypothetical protein
VDNIHIKNTTNLPLTQEDIVKISEWEDFFNNNIDRIKGPVAIDWESIRTLEIPKYIPYAYPMLITPEMARKWLEEYNERNPRKRINNNVVNAYVEDMKNGKWLFNGEPIVFDENGFIKNGQHRLCAIIRSGISAFILVVFNVDPTITSFDHHLKRNVAQELNINKSTATIANVIVSKFYGMSTFPSETVKDYIIEHIGEINLAYDICGIGVGRGTARKRDVYTTIYLSLANGGSEDDWRDFCRIVNTGFSLDRESSPAIVLANYIMGTPRFTTKQSCKKNMEMVIRAFNDFCNGVSRKKAYVINNTNTIEELMQRLEPVMDWRIDVA